MDDLISRQAAIEKLTSNLTYMHTFGADRSIDLIEELPSAQPDVSDTNVGSNLIDRGAALDALDRLEYTPGEWATNGLTMCKDAIMALPSAQQWIPCSECEKRCEKWEHSKI